jgi:hypothetical protein
VEYRAPDAGTERCETREAASGPAMDEKDRCVSGEGAGMPVKPRAAVRWAGTTSAVGVRMRACGWNQSASTPHDSAFQCVNGCHSSEFREQGFDRPIRLDPESIFC